MKAVIDGAIFGLQDRGGVSRIYQEILPRMAAAEPELEIHLLCPPCARQPTPRHERIVAHKLPRTPRLLQHRYVRPLVDLIHSRSHFRLVNRSAHAIWHSTYYTRSPLWRGRRVVLVPDMIHEVLPELFTSREEVVFRARKRRCILEADAVICISESTRRDVLRFVPGVEADRLVVIHLAHSEVFARRSDPATSGSWNRERPFLLTFGSSNVYKGHEDVLAAYRRWEGRRRFDLVVVGAPSGSEVQASTAEDGPGVRRLGPVGDNTLRDLYRSASAFVYPSRYEGFGIPLLEAMASGCPVIASRIPSSLEVAGDVPIYFEPADVGSLVAAMAAAEDAAGNLEALHRGIEHASLFSWDRTAQRVLSLYRNLA